LGTGGSKKPERALPMFSNNIAISISNLSKCFHIYEKPTHRLRQFIFPQLDRLLMRDQRAYYKEFWALKDISFEVKRGETVGIIGRNGSGKSTLLQIICGTLTPTEGVIEAHGRIAALLELGSGFNPEFTGRENVFLNAAVLGLTKAEVEKKFDEIAAFADIGDFLDQPVKTYSSGMVVRLAFAVAINTDPQILIIDEALSVGDELFQRKCFSRIESIRASGATILFVSHSGSTVVELCDRAVLLDAGKRLAIGAPKQIVGHYQKLLYAPPERRVEIQEQIRLLDELPKTPSYGLIDALQTHQELDAQAPESCIEEDFDPHLKPTSSIEYTSRGAVIESPHILTLNGKSVNCLIQGKTYRYRYKVNFDRFSENIRFGMLIKTTSGLELGGAISAPSIDQSIPFVEAGSEMSVEFSFNCHLNPGVYFLNAGVLGLCGNEETFLHRRIDAIAFRVVPQAASTSTEIVDFGCKPSVSLNAQRF